MKLVGEECGFESGYLQDRRRGGCTGINNTVKSCQSCRKRSVLMDSMLSSLGGRGALRAKQNLLLLLRKLGANVLFKHANRRSNRRTVGGDCALSPPSLTYSPKSFRNRDLYLRDHFWVQLELNMAVHPAEVERAGG